MTEHATVPPRGMVAGPVAGVLVTVAALGYAQVALPEQPLLSDYALVPGGMLPVMIGMLALAGACLWLAYGLTVREPARTAATRVLLVATAAGLALCAIFPTDPGLSQINTLEGEVHRWAAAVVFTALPLAGWTLARRNTSLPWGNAVRALSVTSALALGGFLITHPASFTSSPINGAAYYGLLERGVVLAEIALLTAMALASAGGRRHPAALEPPASSGPAAEAGARPERLAA
jgi:hypothetical protein